MPHNTRPQNSSPHSSGQHLTSAVTIVAAAFTALALVGAIIFSTLNNQDKVPTLPLLPDIGGEFALPSTLGKTVSLSDFKGKVVMLNFGYTSCPDICPTVLTRLSNISNNSETQFGIGHQQLQTLFISLDPERDNITHLGEYLRFFNTTFIGFSGTTKATQQVAALYKVYYNKQIPPSQSGEYEIQHSDSIFLIDKQGQLRKIYNQAMADEDLIIDIKNLITESI